MTFDEPSDKELTLPFHSHLPQLIPEFFVISPLPKEVLSWIMLALQTVLQSSWIRSRKWDTKMETESDTAVNPASLPELAMTSSSIFYPTTKKSSSSAPSLDSIELLSGASQEAWMSEIRTHWSKALSKLPQAVWLRHFGTIANKAPFTSKAARNCQFLEGWRCLACPRS